jgi:hypothetical protein
MIFSFYKIIGKMVFLNISCYLILFNENNKLITRNKNIYLNQLLEI